MATGDGPYCFEHGFTRCGCVNSYDPETIGKDRTDPAVIDKLHEIINTSLEPNTVRLAEFILGRLYR